MTVVAEDVAPARLRPVPSPSPRSSDREPTAVADSFATAVARLAGPDLAAAAAAGRARRAAQGCWWNACPSQPVPVTALGWRVAIIGPAAGPGTATAAERNHDVRAALRETALLAAIPSDRCWTLDGLSALRPDQHPADLRRWLADPDQRQLIMSGPSGTGKSCAAYALAVEASRHGAATRDPAGRVIRRPLVVRAWTVAGYLAELRPEGSPHPIYAIRDRARTAGLLILNDIGLDEILTDFEIRELTELADWRCERKGLRTVWTTNRRARNGRDEQTGATWTGLSTAVGPRLWSRMCERASALTFDGHDIRTLNEIDF